MANTNVKNTVKKQKGDVWYTVIAIFIAVCLVVGLLVAILKPTGAMDYITLHTGTPYATENYSVNPAMLQYMTYTTYNNYYSNIYNTYGSTYLSYFGLDNTVPMSQQKYYGSTTQSWLDVCVSEASANIKQVLILCEEATKAGKSLTDEDKTEIDNNIQQLKDYAKSSNVSFSTAMLSMYGSKGITKTDIRNFMEMQYLASAYASEITDAFTYTNEEYEAFFTENIKDYVQADYYSYTITAEYEKDAEDAVVTAAIETAKNAAKELLAKIDAGTSFVDAVYDYEKGIEGSKASTATDDEETAPVEEITKDSIEKDVLKTAQVNNDSEADKWIFADTPAADGATKLIEAEEGATIYQIVKSQYRHEYKSATVRELYISLDDFENAAELQAYADSVVAAFNSLTDKNGEAFSKLAEQFTTDEITVTDSGLIEETAKTTTEGYEDVNAWMFDEAARKTGDITTFVQTDEGIGIYYFESFGREIWLLNVDADMRTADYEEAYKKIAENYTVEENAKAIDKIA